MRHNPVLSLGLAASVLLTAVACDVQVGGDGLSLDLATGRAQDTWTRSYTVAPGGRLELVNVNGRISAEPASGSSVELVGERVARATSDDAARGLLERVEMREEAGESRVRIEVRAPKTFGISSVEVRWSVKVPKGVVVDLRNVNGRIDLSGLDGEAHAQTVNGGVGGKGLALTTLEASTVNGGVEVELIAPLTGDGKVSLESVNGGVALTLHEASRASVTARVTNGGVTVSGLEFQLSGEQTRRRFEGTLNGGGTPVSLETTNGGARLSKSDS
ncbi:MAG: DUF4097 family beta strand repeat-containing protein [Acidobacteriota bacterium]|nr:DUF4097 family beta strand repeat-containing protein [Acidobacteriota bacterium]